MHQKTSPLQAHSLLSPGTGIASWDVKWSSRRENTNSTEFLRKWNGRKDAFKRCYQVSSPSSRGRELMTCWQAHLAGQINRDNLFADSALLSPHLSGPQRCFPAGKHSVCFRRGVPAGKPCYATRSAFWEPTGTGGSTFWAHQSKLPLQDGTGWCVNNLSDAPMAERK